MSRRGVAARLAHRPEPADALRARRRAAQQLTAPDRAVLAQAEAVHRDAEHLALEPVLGHRRGDVGMVVLHRDPREPERLGEPRRHQVRVQVVRDELRLGLEDPAIAVVGVPIRIHRRLGVQVPDVLGQVRAVSGR